MMKRLLFGVALAASAFAVTLLPASVGADISPTQTTQVILSCADGHSVILWADAATLTSLTSDVQALNASGASCTLNTTAADPSTDQTNWTVYDYNPSGQEIAPRNSPGSLPATTNGDTATFNFLPGHYTALLTTTDKSLTGDLSSKTLMDTVSVGESTGTFMTQHNGGDCVGNTPAAVRFYFVSPSASGSSIGTPPAGFYTQFWWSNPIDVKLLAEDQTSMSMSAMMGDATMWSDWNGKRPTEDPSVMEAFQEAIHKVQTVGLSFGGECFFETGVNAPNTPETFSSKFGESG
jgi:hypothetical protein